MRTIVSFLYCSSCNIVFCISVLLSLFALNGVELLIHNQSAIAEPTVITTISVGSGPVRVGVNSSTNLIYVANNSSNTVSVIEDTTNTVLSTISVGSVPFGVGVNSSTNRIYVTNEYSHTVSVIDGTTNTVLSTISVGSYPVGVGVNSSTNRIYVANTNSNTVSAIDGAANTVLSTISVGTWPYGIGVNSTTNRIYVANYSSNTVSVIDGAANTVLSTISVGSGPIDIGVNYTTNRIYVANRDSNTVSIIDGNSNTVLSTISVGSLPYGVGVNSSTNRIYVANYSSNTVSVIEDALATSITPTPTSPTPTSTPVASPSPTVFPTFTPLPTATPSQTPYPGGSGTVYGFVYNADEESLKNVIVNIIGDNFSDSTTTDEDGYYEFSGLKEGDYTLTYEKSGYQTHTEDISLGEGEEMDLGTIIMETVEKGMIYGYVMNIKGNPIEYVRLKLKGINTKKTKQTSSDADGFFEFADLEADTYIITAKKKGFKPANKRVKLGDGEAADIEIEMKKSSRRIAFVEH